MCGIAGKLSWNEKPDLNLVRAITSEMASRGPDADGFYSDQDIALGHRRLAIIDLSEAGRQPMSDHSGRYWIAFNGEIYNFQEVRTELDKLGAEFRSQSDTEVILEAYKAWGVDCLRRFNGMFAFALWDREQKSLFLARDRLGKKPLLYYILPDGGVVFASELKSLLHDRAIPRKICYRALSQYLSLGYVLSDSCFISGVQKLEAGCYAVLTKGNALKQVQYWDLAKCFREKISISLEDAAAEVKRLVDDSTRLRMISDVPLGAFLSGGIDSSAIVAAMCRQASATSKVHTFSIGFNEPTFSELPQARAVADLLGVTHRDQIVDAKKALALAEIARSADEPFADTSMIPTYYLSEFARNNVTVALSGDGGDEIFAGYETYVADKLYRATWRCPESVINCARFVVDRFLPVKFSKVGFDYKLRAFLSAYPRPPAEAHYLWRCIFSEQEKNSLLSDSAKSAASNYNPYQRFAKFFAEVPDCHPLDQAMYVDIKTWLVDDILVKADRMSMAHSLELRAPLLDYRLVEFAASLPVDYKLKGFSKKHVFKLSQQGVVPDQVTKGKKRGFNAPVASWLNSGLEQVVEQMLADSGVFSETVDLKLVSSLFDDHRSVKKDNNLKLLALLNLRSWLQSVFAENESELAEVA